MHAWHSCAEWPHVFIVGSWHWPSASQQPLAQVSALHTSALFSSAAHPGANPTNSARLGRTRTMRRRFVMQRLHENDLAGHLLDQGGWQHLDLPAIAVDDSVIPVGNGKQMTRRIGDILHPEREDKETLDRTRVESGILKFSAQYQQRPVPLEGNLIRRDWFRYSDHLPDDSAKRIVQSWDIAMMTGDANDYSVCTTWWIIKADYYLVDVFRARLQYPDLRRKLASLAAKHGAGTILIENAGPGMALLQDLWRDPAPGMVRRRPPRARLETARRTRSSSDASGMASHRAAARRISSARNPSCRSHGATSRSWACSGAAASLQPAARACARKER